MLSFYGLPVVERRASVRLTQERYNPAALPGSFWAASPAMLLVLSGTTLMATCSNDGLANSSVGPYDPDQVFPTQPVPLEQSWS
jgi:hypothetical protein